MPFVSLSIGDSRSEGVMTNSALSAATVSSRPQQLTIRPLCTEILAIPHTSENSLGGLHGNHQAEDFRSAVGSPPVPKVWARNSELPL